MSRNTGNDMNSFSGQKVSMSEHNITEHYSQ